MVWLGKQNKIKLFSTNLKNLGENKVCLQNAVRDLMEKYLLRKAAQMKMKWVFSTFLAKKINLHQKQK